LKYRREKTQPLQQATLLAEHVVMHHTQTKGIADMDQGLKTSSTQKGKVSPKTLTRLFYRSMSKEISYQKLLKQHWWQPKHTYIQHDQT
jgi:hypothetical protein